MSQQSEPNYRELYFKLFGAVEDAVNILIAAQCACEEMYLSAGEASAPSLGENRSADTAQPDPQAGERSVSS